MKTFTLLLLLACTAASAQNKKPGQNPSTPQELQQRKNEAIQQRNKMTPEQIKMMEQMGIQLPDLDQIPVQSNGRQAAPAIGEIPAKDASRIALAGSTTVNSGNINAYVQKVNAAVLKQFSAADIRQGEETFRRIATYAGGNYNAAANAAIMLWAMGKYKPALYCMLQISAAHAAADDNILNNYAAFLTMAGAEQWAIPSLNYLDKKYPQNSTILNNLGQAWFGLGELTAADKYLKAAIARFPSHPKACYTLALVEESKGNNEKAVELVKKSIGNTYSLEKENKLRKLAYKLKPEDLLFSKRFKPDSDPLGLQRFNAPPIPGSYEEMVVQEPVLMAFKETVQQKITELVQRRQQQLAPKIQQFNNNVQQYLSNPGMDADDKIKPPFYHQAKIMLDAMSKDGGAAFRLKQAKKACEDYLKKEFPALKLAYEAEVKKTDQKGYSTTKEGGDKDETRCPERTALKTKYIKLVREKLQPLHTAYMNEIRRMYSEELFWKQYAQFAGEFEKTKLDYQISFLNALQSYTAALLTGKLFCDNGTAEEKNGTFRLSSFSELYCTEKETIDLGWLKGERTCYNFKISFSQDLEFWKNFAELRFNDENIKDPDGIADYFSQSFISSTLMAGPKVGGELGKGPLKFEAEAGVYGVIEIGKKGITDWGVLSEAKISTPLHDGELVGIESKITVNSGTTLEGKGILQPLIK